MSRSTDFARFKVALLTVGSAALLLSACGEPAEDEKTKHELLMTEYCEQMDLKVSENGRRSFHFQAPLLEGYTEAQEPYREFRKGIKITTYQKDSADIVDAVLTANYGINYERRQLWEARGNVVIIKNDPDSTRIYTQQIFWDQRSGKVYSNVDSRIVRKKGADDFMVSGFETDEGFTFLNSREPDGKLEVDVSKLPRTASDSTAQEEPAAQPTRQSAGHSATRPAPESIRQTTPATTRQTTPVTRQRIRKPGAVEMPPQRLQGEKFKAIEMDDQQVPFQEKTTGPAERTERPGRPERVDGIGRPKQPIERVERTEGVERIRQNEGGERMKQSEGSKGGERLEQNVKTERTEETRK